MGGCTSFPEELNPCIATRANEKLALAVNLTRTSQLADPGGLAAPNGLGATSSKHLKEPVGSQATAECAGWVLEQIQYQLGLLQFPVSTMTVVLAPVSGLVSSSVIPTDFSSVPFYTSVYFLFTPAQTVPSVPTQSTDNYDYFLKIKELNPAKSQTSTDVIMENITTQEAENNRQSVDHNTLPNHTIAKSQYNSLLVMKATQSAPKNLTTMEMRPYANNLVPSCHKKLGRLENL
ncbi:hypothetical protein DSO57_1015971 [Entomophthora muscae]|uniref:Uncharacterized protein n=1 Tax=Entomophthora muscae TaxID=34485 RepID=A0ACC2U3N0_9FUNG|nr:hypothetical protein DSO57_1015971 [Entomophthora muscae]